MSDNVVDIFRWEQDADSIVTLTMDDPGQSANTGNERFLPSLRATIARLTAERATLTGVVLTSAKKTFFAGADLNMILGLTPANAGEFAGYLNEMKRCLRTLETLGIPVVAALNGAALGGGYEIALACHHRIALDAKGSEIGLPEASLGLLPGAGGVVRTVRMFGVQNAMMNILLQGQRYTPAKALELGLIDEVVGTSGELLANAKAWIKANPDADQPWDRKGYRIPGGTPTDPKFAANLPAFPANIRKQLKGQPMPAPRAILAAAVESTQVDIENAALIETRYLLELATGQVAKNMINAFFFDMQAINKGGSRPEGYPKHTARKVVVLGAGMMGAGIAYVTARSGAEVILKDVSMEAAERGKAYSKTLLDKAVQRGRMTVENADEILHRIIPTDSYSDAEGCDLVVEAVFESPALKKQVFADVEKLLAPDALLGSNTSTLPITDLATGVSRPEDFIGLHFFSPVDKMPLVEIVVGAKTSDEAIARAVDYTHQIKKTPIVVNDNRGFFTSRVIVTFANEALAMVAEGVEPASVEQAGQQAGYPAAPLQLIDELNMTTVLKIANETKAGLFAEGKEYVENGAGPVVERMVVEFERPGRAAGAGFYEYDESGKRTGLWPGLRTVFKSGSVQLPFDDMRERMLFAEALETVKCFDEGVLRTVADANIGSLLGIGFPAWTGGVVQYINGYPGGLTGFITRANELADRYGDRFRPTASLTERVARGEQVYKP